ncbi:MAG TPA: tRNA preQ1(34) S-adenosylmethionine ribosyltransferase-isomerase QueA, partial [Verrucomicrobiae bacterium]|nr:tRNA preQ1(34) S-adenosylmethionine ribosyltransferase-isomerase QueA [Verrucomicrobiae bacterium]
MRTADFDYALPPELVAQHPALKRDEARLLVLERVSGKISHRRFGDLPEYMQAGDVLVLNDSKVLPARLRGIKQPTGGAIELLLLTEAAPNEWLVMLRPGKRVRAGTVVELRTPTGEGTAFTATVLEKTDEGHCRVRFAGTPNILSVIDSLGELPLPPYIEREAGATRGEDEARYQTVYAQALGSVAAPTAGLHYTQPVLAAIRARGVEVCFVTLHVGLGTFAPVKAERIEDHIMHSERFTLPAATALAVNRAKREGRRVMAGGTTSTRVLESAAQMVGGPLTEMSGETRLFVHPPREFRVVD